MVSACARRASGANAATAVSPASSVTPIASSASVPTWDQTPPSATPWTDSVHATTTLVADNVSSVLQDISSIPSAKVQKRKKALMVARQNDDA